ncbi:MAG: endonuclease III [Beijerinckiaceae bacterium]
MRKSTAPKNPAAKNLDSAASTQKTKPSTSPAQIGRAAKPQNAGRTPPDQAKVAEIFRRFEAANPHPKGELDFVNAFTLLVAVVLSAQATDVSVNKATRALFALAGSPAKMAALDEEKLQDMIKTIGLYRTKAKNVIALSRRLVQEFGGEVPHSREALETLPGVGRKTANVVMNIAFGAPLIAIDTHIFRLANRVPLAIGKTPLEVERGLEKIIPAAFKRHAHHWLILHGRYICKARRPDCERCLISDLCRWPDKRV